VEWANFGEEMDARARGMMLDESLEILTGLWSGAPFRYEGKHYRVDEALFLPRPIQSPRIPIWIAGVWPNLPPFGRAARWDGVLALTRTSPFVPPDSIREIAAYVRAQRTDPTHFDIVVGGLTPEGSGTERVAAAQAAGATWWLEWLNSERGSFTQSFAQAEERVRRGPPRA
jgi:alkanesulfonate monooxygenase SsuD/methylene tetrahydromethanopterin reductase-like flavin-dependent oxidoreductase (luciferase family)